MNTRRSAYNVLIDIETRPNHLVSLLNKELKYYSYSLRQDRAFVVNLVYSVLRHLTRIDYILSHFLNIPVYNLELSTLTLLRLSVAQIIVLEIPNYAARSEAIKLAKVLKLDRVVGLLNAVLYRLGVCWQEVNFFKLRNDPVKYLAFLYSHPYWLVKELLSNRSLEEVQAWLQINQIQPPICIRVNSLRTTRNEVTQLLAPYIISSSYHSLLPDVLTLFGVSDQIKFLPGFREGLWQVQDPGAVAISYLLGVLPGMSVLDMCAGVGGKTGHLAALMENRGRLLAVEKSSGRVQSLRKNMYRLGATVVESLQIDGRLLTKKNIGKFDRILLDVPCTSLGTIGRRPDIRWRCSSYDAVRLAKLQLELVLRAVDLLVPGGVLLYSTCTITKIENEGVIASVLSRRYKLSMEWESSMINLLSLIDKDCFFRTLPYRDKCDAFFAARLVKK